MIDNLIEVSIFGGGAGYGESILVKISNEYFVIDSFQNPRTSKSFLIDYFREQDINCEIDVKLVISTHWHDDHFKGLADILSLCKSAEFYCSDCISTDEFKNIYSFGELAPIISPTKEISKIINVLTENKKCINSLKAEQLVYKNQINGVELKIYALSPNDFAITKARIQISASLTNMTEDRVLPKAPSPNDASIVLFFEYGDICFLLGGDLPYNNDNRQGWKNIIEKSMSYKNKKSSIFKVSHHGSQTSYNADIWNKLLLTQPIACLTPYKKGHFVPNASEIRNILSHTEYAFITCKNEVLKKRKKRSTKTKLLLEELKIEVYEIPYDFGHIKLTNPNFTNTRNIWGVELLGKAIKLQDY